MLTPEERILRARLAAHSLHAKVDSREITRAATEAFLERFHDEVDPDRELDEDERNRRAEHALKAHMARLSLKAAKARREAAEADE